jgi:hypothetical protein
MDTVCAALGRDVRIPWAHQALEVIPESLDTTRVVLEREAMSANEAIR